MNTFYSKLKNALESSEGDIWVQTVLEGEHAVEKRLLINPEKDEMKNYESILGNHRIFGERIGRTPKLIICGAGHVSMPIIRMGKMLGFVVTVIEDRPKFADNARQQGQIRYSACHFGKVWRISPVTPIHGS